MVEISNNLIAGLLILAIVISGISTVTVLNLRGPALAGFATTDTGAANISITGEVSIELLSNRTETNFGSGTLGGANRELTTNQNNYGTFDDGSEGNDTAGGAATNYGTCQLDPDDCAFPLIVRNTGNQNVSINISSNKNASSGGTPFIGGTGAEQYFRGRENEKGACGYNFTTADSTHDWYPTWVELTDMEKVFCEQFEFSGSGGDDQDEIRVHMNLTVPSDATGTKSMLVYLKAVAA